MTLDVNLYIEQASIYLSNILNINLLLFTASALLFTLGYQKKLNLCWWLVNAGEIALGVWAITIIIRAHRGLLRYIAMRHTNINVDLMSPLDYLTLVYWIDILWLFSLLIRAYLLKNRSKK
ncbi:MULTISPECIES: hypothetical protein [unclassified Legionella]|uniref:hypothetical protein n=1 Tax=unclassified Legionella TaxID=2622702 RepID=UPI003AF42864